MPAALECSGRAFALAVAQAFALASKEVPAFVVAQTVANTPGFIQTLSDGEGVADPFSRTIAEAIADPQAVPRPKVIADPKAIPDPQALPDSQAIPDPQADPGPET